MQQFSKRLHLQYAVSALSQPQIRSRGEPALETLALLAFDPARSGLVWTLGSLRICMGSCRIQSSAKESAYRDGMYRLRKSKALAYYYI